MRVFVYGTLKRNEPNYHYMLDRKTGEASLIGKARSTIKYPLVIASRFNIPFLLYAPGQGHNVIGEIYEVDERKLEFLDDFEGHPGYYERMEDTFELIEDPQGRALAERLIIKAGAYFLKDFRPDMLTLPMMDDYTSSGDHGKPYIDRSNPLRAQNQGQYIEDVR